MSSEDLLEIRESLLSRADEITVKWFNGAVNDPDKRKGAPDEIISILKQVVKGSIELLSSDAFGPSKAAELGEKKLQLRVSPEVAVFLLEERGLRLEQLEKRLGIELDVVDDPSLGREDFRLILRRGHRDITSQFEG